MPRPAAWAWRIAPGLAVCIAIAWASTFVSEHYGGPTLLYALLLGMAFFFLSKKPKTALGIQFGSRTVLRLGVALLGARITLDEIIDLGPAPILIVIGAIALTPWLWRAGGAATSARRGVPARVFLGSLSLLW